MRRSSREKCRAMKIDLGWIGEGENESRLLSSRV